jgi:hypothetical protein
MRAAIALVITVACLGCGTTRAAAPGERQWIANTRGVIRQLQVDVSQLSGADTVAEADKTLTDESRLYAALVVYTDFGGCRHMVAALGKAPARFRRVDLELNRACTNLQRSSALFTRAVTADDARVLAAAMRSARRAAAPLLRGELALGQ